MLDWMTKQQRVPVDVVDSEGRPALFYAISFKRSAQTTSSKGPV